MPRFGQRVSWFQGATRPGRVKSLAHVDAGNHPVSHAQNKSPILKTISIFKSAATALALCLGLQVQADRVGYLKKCREWLAEKHGAGCVVAEWIHFDERSPHIHALVVPLCNGVLNAKAFLGGRETCSDLQTDFYTHCGEPFGLERGLIKSEAKHMKQADWWAAIDAPALTPTKMDFAKAAVGIEVPSVTNALVQANALKAFERSQENLKKRVKKVNERERELAVQESFLGDKMKLSKRVSELEQENTKLKAKVMALENPKPSTFTPGHRVGSPGV